MNNANRVWVVDDDKSIRWVLEKALNQAGISTQCFANAEDVEQQLNHSRQLRGCLIVVSAEFLFLSMARCVEAPLPIRGWDGVPRDVRFV